MYQNIVKIISEPEMMLKKEKASLNIWISKKSDYKVYVNVKVSGNNNYGERSVNYELKINNKPKKKHRLYVVL